MYTLGIGIKGHIVSLHKISQNLIIGSDHPASIEKIEIGHRTIELQYIMFEFSGGHGGDVLERVDGAVEGDDPELASLHYKRICRMMSEIRGVSY